MPPVNSSPVGSVILKVGTTVVTDSSTLTQGQLLKVSNTLTDTDGLGTIHYQWYRGGVAVGAADALSYRLTEADVGQTITVVASYIDGQGNNETKASVVTSTINNLNDRPTGDVVITGNLVQGGELTADTSTLGDLDGLGPLLDQWQADGVDIDGATNSAYTCANCLIRSCALATSECYSRN